jgi:hypothetical protein
MMCIRRVIAACSSGVCLTTAFAGCSSTENEATATRAPQEYDLSRLSELEDDFPPDFTPGNSEVEKLHHVYVPSVGAVVSGSKQYTADPPQCSLLLKPVKGVAGSDSIGILADGLESRSIGVGAYVPVDVPAEIPATGCDRMTYTVPDDHRPYSGTAERIAAPAIDGATTYALKTTIDGFGDPEYFYAAILDNRAYVNVNARLAPDFEAQPLLPDLLVKAVAAIRGQ